VPWCCNRYAIAQTAASHTLKVLCCSRTGTRTAAHGYSQSVTISHLLAGRLQPADPLCLSHCQELVSRCCQPSAPSQTPPACISNSQCYTCMHTLPDCHMYTANRAGVELCEACLVSIKQMIAVASSTKQIFEHILGL